MNHNGSTIFYENSKNTGSYSYTYVFRQYGTKQLQNLVVQVHSLWNGCSTDYRQIWQGGGASSPLCHAKFQVVSSHIWGFLNPKKQNFQTLQTQLIFIKFTVFVCL